MCTNLYIPEEEIQPSNVINQWRIRGGRAGRAPPPPKIRKAYTTLIKQFNK
jgi:hypothetical protein